MLPNKINYNLNLELFERYAYMVTPIAMFRSSYAFPSFLRQVYDVASKTCTIFIHAYWVVDGRRDAVESTYDRGAWIRNRAHRHGEFNIWKALSAAFEVSMPLELFKATILAHYGTHFIWFLL